MSKYHITPSKTCNATITWITNHNYKYDNSKDALIIEQDTNIKTFTVKGITCEVVERGPNYFTVHYYGTATEDVRDEVAGYYIMAHCENKNVTTFTYQLSGLIETMTFRCNWNSNETGAWSTKKLCNGTYPLTVFNQAIHDNFSSDNKFLKHRLSPYFDKGKTYDITMKVELSTEPVSYKITNSFTFDTVWSCTRETLLFYLNSLTKTNTTKTLTLGSINLALLTDEDKKIATDKGWTLA